VEHGCIHRKVGILRKKILIFLKMTPDAFNPSQNTIILAECLPFAHYGLGETCQKRLGLGPSAMG
jgi:hypothetical protein